MRFDLHVGIDYSGAGTPASRLPGLQVWATEGGRDPDEVRNPASRASQRSRWSRQEVAAWIVEIGQGGRRFIVAIDHAFSFPDSYLHRHDLASWDDFLDDFVRHWPTDTADTTVEALRGGNQRTGTADEFRLADTWTPSAKSVFRFNVQGQVAKSSHAGIPWLAPILLT